MSVFFDKIGTSQTHLWAINLAIFDKFDPNSEILKKHIGV